jgi:hypothetical protein
MDRDISGARTVARAGAGAIPPGAITRLSWNRRWPRPPQVSAAPASFAAHEIRDQLDAIAATIRGGAIESGVHRLRMLLHERRRTTWSGGWRILARVVVREHPVFDLIQESPVARRRFEPRAPRVSFTIGERGRRIARCELAADTFRAMRARDFLINAAADAAADGCRDVRVLTLSGARLDAGLATTSRPASLDLICAAGYERLSDARAAGLTARLFDMLAPRGRLLVGAISPEVTDRAYVEACMDWWMTCRDEPALAALAAPIQADTIASLRTFRNDTGHVVCLDLTRA